MLEGVARPRPGLGETFGGARGHHLANALVSFLFACTGPVALILTVGRAGGLRPEEIASWISIAFGLGGVLTFLMSYLYRQPLAMGWTIPGTAIAGAALLKFSFPEIVGAYVVTGAIMLALGLSGGFRKIMDWMPQPIVMAMVAGLFLKFGILAIDGFDKAPIVAVAATAGFALFSFVKPVGRIIPPVLAALAAGAGAIAYLHAFHPPATAGGILANPVFVAPVFTKASLLDLVVPLLISVVVLQNAQGIGILRMYRHDPPPNTITTVCGLGTIVFGLFGSVCTCLTGPANALLCSHGEARTHYIGALIWAAFAVAFGLFAPAITHLAFAVPSAFIYVIGGLAMLRVLQQSLTAAFGGTFAAGAVVCMVVTVTELIPEARFTLLGVGAPFWGLVFGIVTSLILEPGDFRKLAAEAAASDAARPPRPAQPERPARSAQRAAADVAEPVEIERRTERPRPPVPAWALEPEDRPEPKKMEIKAADEAKEAPARPAATETPPESGRSAEVIELTSRIPAAAPKEEAKAEDKPLAAAPAGETKEAPPGEENATGETKTAAPGGDR
jgi:benzoate membrane transport protein